MHPVLYVFPGEERPLAQEIEARAAQIYPDRGVFFLCQPEPIHTVKAKIQQNEAGCNLKRIHIYVILPAHQPEAEDWLKNQAHELRHWFAGDAIQPDMNLCVLRHESPEGHDGRPFLAALPGLSPLFHRVFLLGERNEADTIHSAHWPLIYETLARLPLIHRTGSRLYEQLEAKTLAEGEPLFLSAGIHLADIPEATAVPHGPPPEVPVSMLTEQIQSVATSPRHILRLRGLTLAQGSAALFGQRILQFLEARYGVERAAFGKAALLPLSAPCKGWRVSTVKRQIARAYAQAYQIHRQQQAIAAITRQQEAARLAQSQYEEALARLEAAPPPLCAISLLRYDGLLEESFPFTAGRPCVLRVIGGFPVNAITPQQWPWASESLQL
ncbi:MAG: hypothetical protein FWB88_09320 [Defluviitaleaceae bacterium]|nr:hypothetical protein [Defluviitaleaceae bacterium]MCL2240181.1 hypothetical protein [Defluviitaleaceae bacterium]